MSQENAQKIKLLKIYTLLRQETDEEHPMPRQVVCERLNDMGISSNPRTLSKDIGVLNEFGYEVLSYFKDHNKCFYVPEHSFSTPELRIMIDAVQAASFVTPKKTTELTSKIADLGCCYKAEILKGNMVCFNTRKHTNESVYYIVQFIEDALQQKQKLAFYYFDLNEKSERVFRCKPNGEKKRYYVEPVALIYNEDNYYLMTYSSRHPETTANYRVDRMDQVEVIEDAPISEEALAKLVDVPNYTEQVFKMYNGELVDVVLQFDKSLIGPVFDKFGEGTAIVKENDNTFVATVKVRISPVFYGWVFQFGGKMKIISPSDVINEFDGMKKN